MIIRTGSKVTIHAPHVIKAGELHELIESSTNLSDESFKFQVVGGRKVYGYISSAWRPISDKCVCIAEQFSSNGRERWIDPETQIRIVNS